MKMIQEFKAFAIRGNMVDMAVGFTVGAAFTKLVTALVNDLVMPPLGLVIGGAHFANLAVTLKEAVGDAPAVMWAYGRFIQTVFDFVILAFVIFLLVKGINRLKRKEAAAPTLPPAPSKEEQLLTEIRDLLKAKA